MYVVVETASVVAGGVPVCALSLSLSLCLAIAGLLYMHCAHMGPSLSGLPSPSLR